MTDPRVSGAVAVPGAAHGDAAAVPGDASASADPASTAHGDAAGDASLLALVDRLAGLLERSDLTELEVEAGGTGLILRKPAALATFATTTTAPPAGDFGQPANAAAGTEHPATGTERRAAGTSGGTGASSAPGSGASSALGVASAAAFGPTGEPGTTAAFGSASGAIPVFDAAADVRLTVRAPLTGIFYAAPGPGSPPFVAVGREVVVGQVIGLIEAMKLFNEIKSDQAGRVVRVIAVDGALVKAKQPLIEVGPL